MNTLRFSARGALFSAALPLLAGCYSSGSSGMSAGPGGLSGTRISANGACVTANTLSQVDYRAERTSHVEELLSRIPGVAVTKTASGFSVQIRGTNTLTGGGEPLYLIDGMPAVGNRSGSIPVNPMDIECVEVLKDVGHTSMFGSRGANGVILITTRRGW
ncbi:MAG: TonB-dependent receptor plug domain-containing protein [Gemmatimonadetes bacterium]|nr:TonB-dependent receptor plug domain-containing protein [Gemmatimonadota bacterium]